MTGLQVSAEGTAVVAWGGKQAALLEDLEKEPVIRECKWSVAGCLILPGEGLGGIGRVWLVHLGWVGGPALCNMPPEPS